MKIAKSPGLPDFVRHLAGVNVDPKTFLMPMGLVDIISEQAENFRPVPEGIGIAEYSWFSMSAEQRMNWRDRNSYAASPTPLTVLDRKRISAQIELVLPDSGGPGLQHEDLAYWMCRVGIPKVLVEQESNFPENYFRWRPIAIEIGPLEQMHPSIVLAAGIKATYFIEREVND